MPSNIKGIRARIRRNKIKATAEVSARFQQLATSIYLEELARFTPVDTGVLAGGYVVLIGQARRAKLTGLKNKTRQPSLQNIAIVDRIDGTKEVSIINDVSYGNFVDKGTRGRPGRHYLAAAKQMTIIRLQQKGVRAAGVS